MGNNTICIDSINCRGLRGHLKQSDIFLEQRKKKSTYCAVRKRDLIKEDLAILKKTWNVNFFRACLEKNPGGVLIILNNNFEYKIHN